MLSFWRRYLLPGFIFQSVVIAGGYGIGREFIEFFLSLGPKAGLLAMIISMIIWSLVCACTFVLAQQQRTYDYRAFFKNLLGEKRWWLFEISYLLILILVMAVVIAAAGTILQQTVGIAYAWGVGALIAYVAFMVYRGSQTIEWILSFWSIALYLVYGLLFFFGFNYFGEQITTVWNASTLKNEPWFINGVRYAGYNLALIPAVLFCLMHLTSKQEAIISGLLAGFVTLAPGILFFIIMFGAYPQILNETTPSLYLLDKMNLYWLEIAFTIVLLGTLIETATAMIHAFNERFAAQMKEMNKPFNKPKRAICAIVILIGSALLAQLGLVDLISKGYGWLTWLIVFVYIIPVIFKGIPIIFRN